MSRLPRPMCRGASLHRHRTTVHVKRYLTRSGPPIRLLNQRTRKLYKRLWWTWIPMHRTSVRSRWPKTNQTKEKKIVILTPTWRSATSHRRRCNPGRTNRIIISRKIPKWNTTLNRNSSLPQSKVVETSRQVGWSLGGHETSDHSQHYYYHWARDSDWSDGRWHEKAKRFIEGAHQEKSRRAKGCGYKDGRES